MKDHSLDGKAASLNKIDFFWHGTMQFSFFAVAHVVYCMFKFFLINKDYDIIVLELNLTDCKNRE